MSSTELVEVTNAVAEFDRVGAGLADLRAKYANVVFEVTTAKGMNEARLARAAIREPRYEIERIRKSAKAPLLALGKKLDSEAARITRELEELEVPISDAITTEETRKEAERAAKVAAELARVEALQDRVAELRGNRTLSAMSGSALIAEHISDLEAIPVDVGFEEFQQAAEDAKASGLSWLRQVHEAAVAHETEQARIIAEREELARHRADAARRDAEDRARREAEERAARKAREDEEARAAEQRRIQRELQDREDAQRRKVLADQEAAAKAARDAEAARQKQEREAHEAQLRAEREQQELAARVERDRIAEENRQAAAARKADEDRLAADRAELDRQQAALRKAQEPAPVPTRMRPKADDLVAAVAGHFKVTPEVALRWLRSTDFSKSQDAA